jgi:hypothetical protein
MSGAMRCPTNDHTKLKDPPEPDADHDGEVVDESDLNLHGALLTKLLGDS